MKVPLAVVNALSIMPGTLVIVCSPVLCFGMKELLDKLPSECFIVAVEYDDTLYSIATEHFPQDARCTLLNKAGIASLIDALCGEKGNTANNASGIMPNDCGNVNGKKSILLAHPWGVRRVMRVDLSGGAQIDRAFYDNVVKTAEKALSRYWKNRATLIRFGRLYSRNLFRNIARLPCCMSLSDMKGTVSKPIVVFGAGESMEETARDILKCRNDYYCIAVDAALSALLVMGIVPDSFVSEEAQSIICDTFIGFAPAYPHIHAFLSLTGWSGAYNVLSGAKAITYYATRYCPSRFLTNLSEEGILPTLLPPMGSVGLTATYIALMLRQSGVPVFIAGLDLSYSVGVTHARGASPSIKRLSSSNRLNPCEAYGASFCDGATVPQDNHGKRSIARRTMPNMALYAAVFREQFYGISCLYNAGDDTMQLGIPRRSVLCVNSADGQYAIGCGVLPLNSGGKTQSACDRSAIRMRLKGFYESEEYALKELKDLLATSDCNDGDTAKRITALLRDREYLYLHFPDYTSPTLETHFLRRVRAEADFFLKDIHIALSLLS